MESVKSIRAHGGTLEVLRHDSEACACPMEFAVYLPPAAGSEPVPCLWYLSGLTCTWANVMEKGGILRAAAEHGLAVIAPDTSPRGEGVADDDAYDLGQGAGFYLTASMDPWAKHYRMDRYVAEELQSLVTARFPVDAGRQGITGHSMGGHGALTLHLKYPHVYRSCSAFAPISAPSAVPWGRKAFTAYLGEDPSAWARYDAAALVSQWPSGSEILIDQGTADPFLDDQLDHSQFQRAADAAGQPYRLRQQQGYDHSYYFIATFMDDHVRHHAEHLKA